MQELPNAETTDKPTIEEILAELNRQHVGYLPVEAMQAARRRREEMTPRLIQIIREATQAARDGGLVEGDGSLFAFYLLAEFQAREALPAIIEAVSLPDEGPFEVFSDAITQDLGRILALLDENAPQVADQLIGDRSLNEYVRWDAARTYHYLVRDGRLTREEAVERLRQHLRTGIANEDSEAVNGLVSVLAAFAPREALADIEEAFHKELVEEGMLNLDDIHDSIENSASWLRAEIERSPPTLVEDAIDELSDWASFRPRQPDLDRDLEEESDEDLEEEFDAWPSWIAPEGKRLDWPDEPLRPPETIRNLAPRVGRNDPCPCGSGKKFKKCCSGR